MFRNVWEPSCHPPPTIWSTFYFRASISIKRNFPCSVLLELSQSNIISFFPAAALFFGQFPEILPSPPWKYTYVFTEEEFLLFGKKCWLNSCRAGGCTVGQIMEIRKCSTWQFLPLGEISERGIAIIVVVRPSVDKIVGIASLRPYAQHSSTPIRG